MNEQFRAEFSSLQAFKFFTQDLLTDLESTMRRYESRIEEVKSEVFKHRDAINTFKVANNDFENTLGTIDKKLKAHRNVFESHIQKLQSGLTGSRNRIIKLEANIESATLKVNF